MTSLIASKKKEFQDYVWDHAADSFQAKFDIRAELTDQEIEFLTSILNRSNLSSSEAMARALDGAFSTSNEHVLLVMQLSGLTRNKIVQDVKAYARSRSLRVPLSSPYAMFNNDSARRLACQYLSKQVIRVFKVIRGKVTPELLEVINQATWPGYIRQERAKRMGHEAEYRLACLFRDCGLPFAPAEKADNPLCRDTIIDGVSYDLVSPSTTNARLRVKATVHTANIGQYGESKDSLEIQEAKSAIAKHCRHQEVILLAFIDGVGFESNRAGLEGVLRNADEFCQFRTIWKAAAIVAFIAGTSLTIALPNAQIEQFNDFASRYGATLIAANEEIETSEEWVSAGDGLIRK